MKIDDLDFNSLYEKTNRSFRHCISLEDNKFLEDEIDIRLEDILTEEESVKIEFFKQSKSTYEIEVRIKLLSEKNTVIGYYSLIEDEAGTVIDNYLVFD